MTSPTLIESADIEDMHPDPAASVVHELKTWPQYFEQVSEGLKTFEFRENDRDYQPNNILFLREWDPQKKEYTGRELYKRIGYVLHVGEFLEIDKKYSILSLR